MNTEGGDGGREGRVMHKFKKYCFFTINNELAQLLSKMYLFLTSFWDSTL